MSRLLQRALRTVRDGRGAIAPLVAGAASWGALAAVGVGARPSAHAGGLLAAAGLALSPWRGQAERIVGGEDREGGQGKEQQGAEHRH